MLKLPLSNLKQPSADLSAVSGQLSSSFSSVCVIQVGISQIIFQDMSVLAQALTTQPLLHILGFEGLTNRGPNTSALYLCNCHTINPPSSLTENPIYRHLSQPDRTGLLVVQPHSQLGWSCTCERANALPPVPAKCLVLGTSIPPSACK